ncbi:MAG TPA: hypothetical protein VGQ57_02950 [Polyangiaceae bacterium]|nr:hypothetical protein [Polyangiaceae bacterium]
MTTRGRLLGWTLLGLLGGLSGQGCGSSSRHDLGKPSSGAGSSGKGTGTMTVEPQGGQGGLGGMSQYDALCGISVADFCLPDDETTTADCKASFGGSSPQIPTAGRGAGGAPGGGAAGQAGESAAGAGAMSGATADAGGAGVPSAQAGATSNAGAAGDSLASAGGGAGGEGGQAPSGTSTAGQGVNPGSGGTSPASAGTAGTAGVPIRTVTNTSSCQVTTQSKNDDHAVARCLPAGMGNDGAPCFSGADCRAGLACVGDGPGQCRPYCCAGESSCSGRTHCAVESLVLATTSVKLPVPVCMPIVDCSLAEPYPCPDGATCSCSHANACVVVGSDKTTSCVPAASLPPKGKGEAGMACPCAWGFVCSHATNECVKLCEVAARDLYCGGARCQPSSTLPDGWGTCVGTAPKQ